MRRYEWMFEQPWDAPRRGGYEGGFQRGAPSRGYDRGVYGGAHPGYGGYPGARERGAYWGGGYGGDFRRGGHDRAPGGSGGYDRGYGGDFARAPFMPEQAYRRHPEYRHAPDRPWPHGDYGGPAGDDFPDDRQILYGVQRRLYEDVWVDIDEIEIEVEDGVVTLTGEVADFMEARYAWDDAWETPGVRGVVNNLTVRTDLPRGEVHGDLVPQTSQGHATAAELEAEGG